MSRCIPSGTPRAACVAAWALLALLTVCVGARAADGISTRVLFSFGTVETLRDGELEWEFARPNVVLGPHDIVRMPPGALLRLESVEGDRLDLLTGIGEGTPGELLSRAATRAERRDPQSYARSAEAAEVVVLPVGAPSKAPVEAPAVVSLTPEMAAAWMNDRLHEHELTREIAARALDAPRAAPSYMPVRVATAHALFAAMAVELSESPAFRSLFPDGSSAPAFAFAALLTAADIPIRRYVGGDGRPVVLLDTGVGRDEAGRVTVSRALTHARADGVVETPLAPAPGQTTFLEAWYAAEGVDPDAD